MRPLPVPALLVALWLSACAPTVAEHGAVVTAPTVADDRLVMADGAKLPLRAWLPEGPPKAVVLALHGFNDYSNAFAEPAATWKAQGIATYAYDQRGFGAAPNRGLWPGSRTLVGDLETAAALVQARHSGVPLYLLGESMGGAVLLVASAEGRTPSADGLILVAPAVRGPQTIGALARGALWLFAHTIPWLAGQPGNIGTRASDNIEMLRRQSADPMVIKETRIDAIYGLVALMGQALDAAAEVRQPTLLLYGANDDLVPEGATQMMLERLPASRPPERWRLALYPGGFHMLLRDLDAAAPIGDVAAWVLARQRDPTAPLPSGADQRGLAFARPPGFR